MMDFATKLISCCGSMDVLKHVEGEIEAFCKVKDDIDLKKLSGTWNW